MARHAARIKREGNTSEEIVRSKIWYDDGSVILQAESNLCRVHWTVLAQHSSFFSDMRAVPQPLDDPLIEGCPIIQLSDSIQDLEHLLRALYNPLFDAAETLDFPVVAAIVRLGKKYEFTQLLSAAVARLTAMFPPTLAQIQGRLDGSDRIREDGGLLFDAINLASETGLDTLLPSLYFDTLNVLGKDGLDQVMTGMVRNDQTTAKLSFESQITLVRCQKVVTEAQAKMMFGWLDPNEFPTQACCDLKKCDWTRNVVVDGIFSPLYTLRTMHKWYDCWDEDMFCAKCLKVAKSKFEEGSEEFWDTLPEYFELPGWDELQNDI
ncbi:hypothetical protein MVEN_00419800 [Mycena venus]|uniref:BTB domain-containing protein n=1 Tax=Mycena venus TaxID=2733690 RepID=A0A8H6YSH3_9AGAR|nr:hypothetical protein MVEN_00419800 [Mycena venus]